MNFGPDLAELIREGRKTVTRRMPSDNPRSPWFRGGCSLKVDGHYAVCPGRGKRAIARVWVQSVSLEPAGQRLDPLTKQGLAEARAEGFPSVAAFVERWRQLHGEWEPGQDVWRVEFVLVERA